MRNLYERVFGSGPTGIVASAALLVAAALLKPFVPGGDLGLSAAVRWSVLLVTGLAAAALATWCVRVLPVGKRGRQLCECGPYRFVRHPFYAAFLSLFDFGLALFLNHVVFLLWALLLHPLWHLIIRYEERLMLGEFGDAYHAYAARTGRFLPRLSAFRRGGPACRRPTDAGEFNQGYLPAPRHKIAETLGCSGEESAAPVAKDSNDFALALSGQLLQRPGNVFFSPFGVRTVVAMACAGARGETATQMRGALHFASANEGLDIASAETIQRLNTMGGDKCEMVLANSLWGQEGAPLQTGFVDLIARHYGGSMHVVDFRHAGEAARLAINQWVEDKTRQKIRELIPSGSLNVDTRLVLANVVCFKGMWRLPFCKTATRDEPFYLEDGSEIQASLMHQQAKVRYLQTRGFQAVDLDYGGGDLAMIVLLPDKRDGLREFEAKLSSRMLNDCVAKMTMRDVKLFVPQFRMTWGRVDLGPCLSALGMPLAFTRCQADFSGINGHEPSHKEALFISGVFHKAFVEVNEAGTEAAAATGGFAALGSLSRKPPPVPIFRADHPFLFAIRDCRTGAILFLGRMASPTPKT